MIVRLLAGTVVLFLAMVTPTFLWILPEPIRRRPIGMAWIGLAAAYGITRAFVVRGWYPLTGRHRIARLLDRVEATADLALSGGLSVGVLAVCLAFLATWVPHYVLWPWHRDADTFATLARWWDAGILPYRDIRAYNFPGAIYLHWLLARAFGWGRTWPLYVFDAACLIGLGMILAAWSWRTLGGMLPGLASYLIFLTFYLSHDYQLVAGRDWHTSLCIALGLLTLQAWPGRTTRTGAAILAAAALSLRPHAILFLPALAWGVLEGADRAGAGSPAERHSPARRLAIWFLMLGAFTAAAFSPLLIAGIADDLVRGLRIAAYGGPYSRASLTTASNVLTDELQQSETSMAIGLLLLMLVATRGAARRRAVTWALALGATLFYRPIHPVQHRYLALPLVLISSISLAPSMAWILDRARVPSFFRAIVSLVLIGEASLGLPTFCSPSATVAAMAGLARGETIPVDSPPGSSAWFNLCNGRRYPWEDYRNTLIYLRRTTSPRTVVANVLKEPPFPAINGPTGCLSPFRAESGICWMWHVRIDLDPEFAAALEQATDSLVVWSPEEHQQPSLLHLDRLATVIRDHYCREIAFGQIEVWRRADAAR